MAEDKYCWRCRLELPFLDEAEYTEITEIYRKCMKLTNPDQRVTMDERFTPVVEAFERITCYPNMNHNAAMHHRLSNLGADCPNCAKPLRTPKAKYCPECGWFAVP